MGDYLGPSAWLIAAVLFAVGELIAPGFFLIWIAAAAGLTGIAALATTLPLAGQFGLFAVLALLSTWGGRRWYVANPVPSSDPLLNDRVARLVGESVVVVEAIHGGRGRVRVGDTVWEARGADAPAGAYVTIVGADDGALVVVSPRRQIGSDEAAPRLDGE